MRPGMRDSVPLCRVAVALLVSVVAGWGQTFSITNLSSIPAYERYVFDGRGSKVSHLPVVMEYRVRNAGREDAHWSVSASMKLRETLIEEEYEIRHANLLSNRFRRRQTFERGTSESMHMLDVDTRSDDPEEFIVGAIPALMYILRTFPFDSPKGELRVRSPQQEKGHLNLRVRNRGKTVFNTEHFGDVAAWHLEVSLMVPVVGGLLPRLNYYFRDDAQKTLIGMKGVLPATGQRLDVELHSYTTAEKVRGSGKK